MLTVLFQTMTYEETLLLFVKTCYVMFMAGLAYLEHSFGSTIVTRVFLILGLCIFDPSRLLSSIVCLCGILLDILSDGSFFTLSLPVVFIIVMVVSFSFHFTVGQLEY